MSNTSAYNLIMHSLEVLGLVFVSAGASEMASRLFSNQYKSLIVNNLTRIWIGVCISLLIADITGESVLLHRIAAIGFGILAFQASVHTLSAEEKSSLVKDIIKAKTVPGSRKKNQLTDLEARAYPNQRLRDFFGVENCFTSTEASLCESFRKEVGLLLHVKESRWTDFAAAARMVARHELDGKEEISLFAFVQTVSLKTMLCVLFDLDPALTDNDEQIRKLAHEINVQWLQSKNGTDSQSAPSWSNIGFPLHDALKSVFPMWDETDTKSNPLNLILPGYETMWRVVLRCLIEVTSRGHGNADNWRDTLEKFALSPILTELKLSREYIGGEDSHSHNGPSAQHIAQEALRLYPPTRRVYRDFKDSHGNELRAAADIEALQRDPDSVWGAAPTEFWPDRWITLSEKEQEGHFLPFGAKPRVCPAKRDSGVSMPFGIGMIALLVGVILLETEKAWQLQADLPEEGVPLDTDREAYGSAKLVKFKAET